MATYDQFQVWPKDIQIQEAKKQWDKLSERDLIVILSKYHIAWQNLQNSKLENSQTSPYLEELYRNVDQNSQITSSYYAYCLESMNQQIIKQVEISNKKEEIIRSYSSKLKDLNNELLNYQEITSMLQADVQQLKMQSSSENNLFINQYNRITMDEEQLNTSLLTYKTTTDFNNKRIYLEQVIANIKTVIESSERLIMSIQNFLNQSNKSGASEENYRQKLYKMQMMLTNNNKLLGKLMQHLEVQENEIIIMHYQNERLQQEIMEKTREINQIQSRFQETSEGYQQQQKQQKISMQKLSPTDYDSHQTKSQRIEKSLNNMKNHFCEFGCNLFLRILNDCQTQIQAFNNQELETLLLDQIKELQKISNLEQQEKLLQGNLNILAKFNNQETLVINRDILKEVQNMLENIRNLQNEVNYR